MTRARVSLAILILAAAAQCAKSQRRAPAPVAPARPLPPVVDASRPDAAPRATADPLCGSDGECGWDDPCVATRCQPGATPPAGCDKSRPPPGQCRCLDHRCTLEPKTPPAATAACDADRDCQPDPGGAVCVRGAPALGPIDHEGPICTCAAHLCQLTWSAPVPCQTFKDCSLTHEPRLRPVPSSQVPRPVPGPVRPCRDGETDSVCGPDQICHIVAWSC